MRLTVSCSMVRGPGSCKNCLGVACVLSGQRRVPLPPASTDAYMLRPIRYSLLWARASYPGTAILLESAGKEQECCSAARLRRVSHVPGETARWHSPWHGGCVLERPLGDVPAHGAPAFYLSR